MTTYTKLAGLGLAALVLGTSFAQAGNNGVQIDMDKSKLLLRPIAACVVAGTPSEFPNDISIVNKGATIIKAGTTVKWSVPFANAKGSYKLTADLAAGKSVFLSGVIPGGVEAGHDCKASI